MSDIDDRLTKCFMSVFPALDRQRAMGAAMESVESWDSIASATLLGVVAEDFGIAIDYEVVDTLNSYGAIRDYIGRRLG